MNKPLWMVIWILAIELMAILLLIPGDFTDKAIKRESILVEESLGLESRKWIQGKATGWYKASMIDSGFYHGMYNVLIPTREQARNSKGMEKMGAGWFSWVKGRMIALTNVVYQICTRLALLLSWLPYMLILFIPAAFDGLMSWNIKRTNFDYVSPVIQRYSLRVSGLLVVGMFIAFFMPFAVDPIIIPAVMMTCCVFMGLVFGNLQKRV